MKALLGKKLGMSQVFSPTGEVVPVTLILAWPNEITLRRKQAKDGYAAVQLALPKKAESDKEEKDGAKRTPSVEQSRYVAKREFEGEIPESVTSLTVEQFQPGDVVKVRGVSKGKGFQGVVKRHKFKGGPASHGHSDWERRPGSIGSRFAQHTRKGKRMAGRMGADKVTVKNLQVVKVDVSHHLLALKGAVPGARGTVLEISAMVSSDAKVTSA